MRRLIRSPRRRGARTTRHREAERLRGLEVDNQLEAVGCSTGRSAGLAPFRIGRRRGHAPPVRYAGAVSEETAGIDKSRSPYMAGNRCDAANRRCCVDWRPTAVARLHGIAPFRRDSAERHGQIPRVPHLMETRDNAEAAASQHLAEARGSGIMGSIKLRSGTAGDNLVEQLQGLRATSSPSSESDARDVAARPAKAFDEARSRPGRRWSTRPGSSWSPSSPHRSRRCPEQG